MKNSPGLLLGSLAVSAMFHFSAASADWPQWRGPNRDGLSKETGLLKSWESTPPKLLWQAKALGSGYGSPAIAGNNIYLVSNHGMDKEVVQALDPSDGTVKWSTTIGKVGNPDQQPNYPAARSTPTVAGEFLYVLGSDGDMACLQAENGKVVWTKNIRTEFGGKPGNWAYAESPLLDGDRVICMPGGAESTMVALDKKDGSLIWKTAVAGAENANFSSAISAEITGSKQYVALTGGGLVGVNPENGKVLWLYEKTRSKIGTIPTPVSRGNIIYSGSNRVGGGAVRVDKEGDGWKATELYFDPKLPTAIGGFVVLGDHLYGSSAQTLLCADLKTGEIQWSERSAAPGAVVYADERLYLYSESGPVLLIEANPARYAEAGRLTPPHGPEARNQMEKTWAYPVIANGRLYLRNKESLWCYDLKGQTAAKPE